MTYRAIEKLVKSGALFSETDPPHDRNAILYCRKCLEPIGEYDVFYQDLNTVWYCGNCVQKYKKETPYNISNDIKVIIDNGSVVTVKYNDDDNDKLPIFTNKICHFNKKGRFIVVKRNNKSKRYYL